MAVSTFIIIGILVLIAGYGLAIYNNLVALKHRVAQSWANIDVLLKQRHDELPKLVETCKQYMKFEQETLERVIQARSQVASAAEQEDIGALGSAETALRSGLGRLFALAENYPDLKANQNFLALQEELTATEDKVGYARQFYNDSVLSYNNKLQAFPTVIFARMMKFERREYFETDEASREVPKVQF